MCAKLQRAAGCHNKADNGAMGSLKPVRGKELSRKWQKNRAQNKSSAGEAPEERREHQE